MSKAEQCEEADTPCREISRLYVLVLAACGQNMPVRVRVSARAHACMRACAYVQVCVCVNVWCACVRACDRACLCAGWGKCACACVSVYGPTRGSVHMCVRACVCGRRSTCLSTRQDVESLAVSSSPHSHPRQEKDAAV